MSHLLQDLHHALLERHAVRQFRHFYLAESTHQEATCAVEVWLANTAQQATAAASRACSHQADRQQPA
jgi:hypothetical protein